MLYNLTEKSSEDIENERETVDLRGAKGEVKWYQECHIYHRDP